MKKETKLLMGTAMVALSAVALTPQAKAATQAINIDAKIFAALALSAPTALNFGVLTHITTGVAGTATKEAGSGTAIPGTSASVAAAGGSPSDGLIKVTAGEASVNVVVTFTNNTPLVAHTTATLGVTTMAVNMDCGAAAGVQTNCVVGLNGGGTGDLDIGGVLNVQAAQVKGTYQGTVTVGVNYQ